MNALGSLAYALGLIPGALAVAGNLRGGPWALGATIFFVALCVADWFVRDNRREPPVRSEFTPDLILVLHVLVNAAAIGTLLYGVASGRLPRWRINDATLSTGLNSGISGIVVAHELIHRRARAWRALGIGNLLMVNYAHFYIEHLKGHHRLVGTRRDPSTARPGETIYHFLLRSVPAQFVTALRIEADRLAKVGRARFSLANFVVATTIVQISIAMAIGLELGPRALTAYLAQGAVAVLLLQAVNYLQHSGLQRPEGSRVAPAHSWQSDRVSSRFLLLELPRHADHHGHAAKKYHALVSHDDSPTLPFGLLGTIPVVLIPPLWFALARRSQGAQARFAAADNDRSVPASPSRSSRRRTHPPQHGAPSRQRPPAPSAGQRSDAPEHLSRAGAPPITPDAPGVQ
jgi:alkane 1-monooxygenase